MKTVLEAQQAINPLSMALSRAMLKSVDFVYDMIEYRNRLKHEKHVQEVAAALKIEYPFESEDYIAHLVRTKLIPEGTL